MFKVNFYPPPTLEIRFSLTFLYVVWIKWIPQGFSAYAREFYCQGI